MHLPLRRHGHPHRPVGVEADAVGNERRQIRPAAAALETAVAREVEGGEPASPGLGHDQRAAVRRDRRSVGEEEVVGRDLGFAVGVDAHDAGRAWVLRLAVIEPEVADPGAPVGADHHVVAVAMGEPGEIGVEGEAAGIEPQQLAIEHRDHQQAPVGQPAQPGRLVGDFADGRASGRPGSTAITRWVKKSEK